MKTLPEGKTAEVNEDPGNQSTGWGKKKASECLGTLSSNAMGENNNNNNKNRSGERSWRTGYCLGTNAREQPETLAAGSGTGDSK